MMRSLYWKICVTFIIVVAASLGAGRWVFHASMMARMPRGPRYDWGASTARMTALALERLIASGADPASAASTVTGLVRGPGPVVTLVLDPSGRSLTGTEVPQALQATVRRLVEGRDPTDQLPSNGAVGPWAALGPVGPTHRPGMARFQAGPHGGMVVVTVRPPGEEFLPAAIGAAGAALVTTFGVAALLGLGVFRVLTRRLTQLQTCVAGLADGQLSLRVPDPGADEIGDLGRSLNRMAGRLEVVVGQLEDTDRRRRQLLADISHELKTPLTVMRGHLEGLADGGERAGRADAGVALEEADRLGLLVDDLLELARMQSSEFRLVRKEVVLQRVVQKALDRFDRTLTTRRITLARHLSDEPLRMMLDHRRIEQVVANLVQNALQSVANGGHIGVHVSPHSGAGPTAEIVIEDDGRGVPPAELERVFDRFHSGSGDGGSTGLGLSIVKQLVEAHGGAVRLENRPAGGIRAIVELR